MDLLLVLGVGLLLASAALAIARDFVIGHVTSKPLGSLAPGYAASRRGYYVYAALVGDLGLIVLALHFAILWILGLTIGWFIGGSIVVIVGEVRTYRALKR